MVLLPDEHMCADAVQNWLEIRLKKAQIALDKWLETLTCDQ